MTSAGRDSLAEDLRARLSGSPRAYPQKIDLPRWSVLVILLDLAAYRAASFLDDRILSASTQGAWLPVDHVAEASRRVPEPRPLHFIFHTGHVGSTLVSRLLDEAGEVLSLREPVPLRTLADAHDGLERADSLLSSAQFDELLRMFLRLWSRGEASTRSVVLKATSSAGRLAGALLRANAGSRAIYLNVRAETYLATLLAGENSPADLRGHGPERMRRLRARTAAPLAPLHALSPGELAALSWLSESWTQRDALAGFEGRVAAVDFERFLAAVGDGMARILRHFELTADAGYLSRIEHSHVLTHYSKAPEHAYTPALRAEILRESRSQHRAEIRHGMLWLERLAQADATVAELLNA